MLFMSVGAEDDASGRACVDRVVQGGGRRESMLFVRAVRPLLLLLGRAVVPQGYHLHAHAGGGAEAAVRRHRRRVRRAQRQRQRQRQRRCCGPEDRAGRPQGVGGAMFLEPHLEPVSPCLFFAAVAFQPYALARHNETPLPCISTFSASPSATNNPPCASNRRP